MGDVIRRIARGLYERSIESEKKEARDFFEILNPKREGKISVVEFKRSVGVGSNENALSELDLDGDGFLDFDDVLVLFYYTIKREITILQCCECSKLLFGPSYSCFQCFFKSADQRFALCRDCYAAGEVEHRHLLTATAAESLCLRDHALLLKFSDLISAHASSSPPKKELKKMWEKAKYKVGEGSPAVEAMAENYFKSMGSNNEVDIQKFSNLTIQQEEFLTTTPHSHPATNYMKNQLTMKFRQHNGLQTTPTYSATIPNPEAESNGISPLKLATITFKIVEMALTIGSISSMCSIM